MNPTRQEQVTFWRTLGAALKAGRPLTRCLDEVASVLAGTAMEAVCRATIERLAGGATLSRALLEFPGLFDARVVRVVAAAEEGGILDVESERIAAALAADDLDRLDADAESAEPTAQDGPAADYVRQLVLTAVSSRASDIHVEATQDGRGRVRLRVDGVLREQDPPAEGLFGAVVARLKTAAALDVAEARLPQDGRFSLQVEGDSFDLRLSTIPNVWGERIVCRVLARRNIPLGLGHVGLDDDDLAKVRRLCELPSGIVIVNGPTGCGKTTILYSMLMEINRPEVCVMTAEDPVEVTFEGLSQLQIKPSVGLTFARAIRSMLRQDPDVMMVGELRDLETMQLCVQVALTGHVLLTTLHAQTSVGAVRRLIDCGVEPFLVNSALEGVVTLRLVRVLCPKCRRPAEPAEHCLSPEAVRIIDALDAPAFCEPVGCEHCGGSGYRGRRGIFEVLAMDERIRRAVGKPVDTGAIREAARASGMTTMLADGLAKAARGVTSVREVLRVVPPEEHA